MLQINHPYVHHDHRSIARGAFTVPKRFSASFVADELSSAIMGKRDGVKSERPSSRSYSISHSIGGRSDLSESDAEKKRSKLGYQRISIACAHCRRRKIRCLIAAGDPEQRCQNCIRLKKECVFYPVDQQTVIESQMSVSGKSARSKSDAGAASPPGALSERRREAHEISSMRSSSNTYHGLPIEPGRSLPVQAGYEDPEYDYRAGPDAYLPRYHPQVPYVHAHPTPNYWRSPDSRPSHEYGSFPPDSRSSVMSASSQQSAVPPEQGWQHSTIRPAIPYQRTLSYGDHESMANSAAYPYGATVQPSTHSQAANIRYATSNLDVHGMPIHPSTSGHRVVPSLSHGASQMTHQQPYAVQQAYPATTTSASQPIYSSQWYAGAPSSGQGSFSARSE